MWGRLAGVITITGAGRDRRSGVSRSQQYACSVHDVPANIVPNSAAYDALARAHLPKERSATRADQCSCRTIRWQAGLPFFAALLCYALNFRPEFMGGWPIQTSLPA